MTYGAERYTDSTILHVFAIPACGSSFLDTGLAFHLEGFNMSASSIIEYV
jgi:hypothetical protein